MGVFAPMGEVSTRERKAQQASVELRAMDELAAQDSPMHRLSPLSKLFVTVLYIVVTVSFHKYDISGVFVMVLFPLVGYQVSMIPVHTCFHKLRVVMPLVCAACESTCAPGSC